MAKMFILSFAELPGNRGYFQNLGQGQGHKWGLVLKCLKPISGHFSLNLALFSSKKRIANRNLTLTQGCQGGCPWQAHRHPTWSPTGADLAESPLKRSPGGILAPGAPSADPEWRVRPSQLCCSEIMCYDAIEDGKYEDLKPGFMSMDRLGGALR